MATENKNQKLDENKNPEQGNQQEDSKMSSLIASYKKSYPKEKTFHVTSDYQVFLGKDLALAKMHQKNVNKDKEVETIKV